MDVILNYFLYLKECESITLGTKRMWKGRGSKRRCVQSEGNMIYIPLLKSLKQLLQTNVVYKEVVLIKV